MSGETIPHAWFTRKTSLAEIERLSVAQIRALKRAQPGIEVPEVPFGREHAAWQAFRATCWPGDEIWEFESPRELWDVGQGRCGFVAVRAGLIVASIMSAGAEAGN